MNLNPPPLKETVDAYPKIIGVISKVWQAFFNNLYLYVSNGVVDYSASSIQVPIAGFSITIGDTTRVLTLNPAGVLATGTIVMPANPFDGMSVEMSSTQTVTALTQSPSGSQTIKNAITTMVAGIGYKWYYVMSSTTWYRVY